jgi:hypothetical protein
MGASIDCHCNDRQVFDAQLVTDDTGDMIHVDVNVGSDDHLVDIATLDQDLVRTLSFRIAQGQALGACFGQLVDDQQRGILVLASLSSSSVLAPKDDGTLGMCPGDVILAFQGVQHSPKKFLHNWKNVRETGGDLEITVLTRPDSFDADLRRTDKEKLGFMVAIQGDVVVVTQILDRGAAVTWNRINWSMQITVGDTITAVNAVPNAAKDMLVDMQDSWKTHSKVSLSFSKCTKPNQPCMA